MPAKEGRNKLPTSFTLTPRSKDILEALATYYGTSRTAVVEMMIRDRARELNIIAGPTALKDRGET